MHNNPYISLLRKLYSSIKVLYKTCIFIYVTSLRPRLRPETRASRSTGLHLGPPACWGLRPQNPAAFSQTVLTLQCWCLFVLLYNLENLDLLKGKKYDYSTLKGYFCIYIAL